MKEYGYEEYVSFDLGSLSAHAYYTGIIFHAFTFGTGDAVLSGGRYDELIEQFGVKKASIGYSIVADRLLDALNRQRKQPEAEEDGLLLVYDADALSKAEKIAFRLRGEGKRVGILAADKSLEYRDYTEHSEEWGFSKVIMLSGDKTSLLLNKDGTAEPVVTSKL